DRPGEERRAGAALADAAVADAYVQRRTGDIVAHRAAEAAAGVGPFAPGRVPRHRRPPARAAGRRRMGALHAAGCPAKPCTTRFGTPTSSPPTRTVRRSSMSTCT